MKPFSLVDETTFETSNSPLTLGCFTLILWECRTKGAETVSSSHAPPLLARAFMLSQSSILLFLSCAGFSPQ